MATSGVILIEGPDCQGKTTLANYLRDQYGAVVLHHGYRFRRQIFTYHTAGLLRARALAAQGHLVVLDRLWPSELMYAGVYRGGSPWAHGGRMADRALLSMGAVYVFCLADPELSVRAIIESPGRDLYQDQDKARQVYEAYAKLSCGGSSVYTAGTYADSFMKVRRLTSTFTWNYTVTGASLAGMAHTLVNQATERYLPLVCPGAVTGGDPHTMRALVVGEKLNPKNPRVTWPFYEYGNSSLHLAEVLEQVGVSEADLGWANVGDPGFSEMVRLARDHAVPIVALGKVAQRATSTSYHAPHPQWSRRFDRHGKVLQTALREIFTELRFELKPWARHLETA